MKRLLWLNAMSLVVIAASGSSLQAMRTQAAAHAAMCVQSGTVGDCSVCCAGCGEGTHTCQKL